MILMSLLILWVSLMSLILKKYKGLMHVLILLEILSFSLFMMIIDYFYLNSFLEIMFFLVLIVLEAAVGLVVLLSKVQYNGFDNLKIWYAL